MSAVLRLNVAPPAANHRQAYARHEAWQLDDSRGARGCTLSAGRYREGAVHAVLAVE